jgi:hypothetical protein
VLVLENIEPNHRLGWPCGERQEDEQAPVMDADLKQATAQAETRLMIKQIADCVGSMMVEPAFDAIVLGGIA